MAVGIGEENNGGMKGADIISVHRLGGSVVAQDMFSKDFAFPVVDEKQHVQLLSSASADGYFRAVVRRVLRTCDPQDLAVRREFPHYLLHALGDEGVWSMGYHGTRLRGSRVYNFYSPDPLALHGGTPAAKTGTRTFEVLFPNVTVPTAARPDGLGGFASGENQYKCMVVPLRNVTDLATPLDIVAMHPVVDSGKVHHMIVAACVDDPRPDPSIPYGVDPANDMFDCPMGGGTRHCAHLGGYAAGAVSFIAPTDVGVRVAENVKWILTDTHFYNPELTEGVQDNGGMRYEVAPSLQPQVAGIIIIGIDFTMQLPHGMREAGFGQHCSPKHLEPLFGDRDTIQLMDIFQHTHNRGIKSRTFVVRDGKRIPLFIQNHYDYNFQGQTLIDFTLRRGDALELYCGFDTHTAVEEIRWGERTQDEMCFNTITFFPAAKPGARLQCLSYTTEYMREPGRPVTWTFYTAGHNDSVDIEAINKGVMVGCATPPAACPAAMWNTVCVNAGACFQKQVCDMTGCRHVSEHPKLSKLCPQVYDTCLPCYAPGEGECEDCVNPCDEAIARGWLVNQTGGPSPVPLEHEGPAENWWAAKHDLPWGDAWVADISPTCTASCAGCEEGLSGDTHGPTSSPALRGTPAPTPMPAPVLLLAESESNTKVLVPVVVVLACAVAASAAAVIFLQRLLAQQSAAASAVAAMKAVGAAASSSARVPAATPATALSAPPQMAVAPPQ
eukprot:TRINITY_DN1336_c0_g2_i1.p1 TRINITY_DN1336_c0_g2~~TRINITY_DN1336_c0_g2_i1.p1  ORF type:complete len:814 (+),score=248.88 TRINITY_DN1336_c0_g2_i1:269-2443(+)